MTLTRRWTLEDSVHCVRVRAKLGVPPYEEESKELAVGLLEAIYCGDHELFNRIADVLRDPEKYLSMPSLSSKDFRVFDAITDAATNAGRPPTREEVRDTLAKITIMDTGEKLFPTVHESDKLQKMLEKIGFGWLAHNRRGIR